MKRIILSLITITFLVTSFFTIAFAEIVEETKDAAEPKEAFTIDFLQNKKAPVEFPHKKHFDEIKIDEKSIACKECHHTLKPDEKTPKACKECHVKGADTEIEGLGTAPNPLKNEKGTKNILHDKCVKCHKKQDKGPKKCNECHPKE